MENNVSDYKISVIMPIYNQSSFVKCAVESLLNQKHTAWELIIVDDGSTDSLEEVVSCYLSDNRIRYLVNDRNRGLGYSLNKGLDVASFSLIAYLPGDDIYFENHLSSLVASLIQEKADLVYSGIIYNLDNIGGEGGMRQSCGKIENYPLQLVQVLHRRTADRWMEREEMVTDDLHRMFWGRFLQHNPKEICTRQITCEWVSHLYQRHRIMNDHRFGGIYMYKTYYGVNTPIRYQSSVGNFIDEPTHYQTFRNVNNRKKNGLKILLVGELSYNPERITALEKRGHRLYGLWINNPFNFNSVGHFPFGEIEDIPFNNWEKRVREIKPDIIYALTNFKAVDLAHHVLMHSQGIPFVWHFKEGPFYCRTLGLWDKLIDLYEKSDGAIFINEMVRQWFALYLRVQCRNTMVFDADLPALECFAGEKRQLLSERYGELHTVIAGRLLGIGVRDIEMLASQGVHLHIYGDVFHNQSRLLLDEALALAPEYVHLHPNCPSENWVSEFSQYDAGWLHYFQSNNGGNLMRANWIDMNSPARMATYAIAGLPMIMHDNTGHLVHHQKYLEAYDMDIPIASFKHLKDSLADREVLERKRENVWKNREIFCFEHYADSLIDFFNRVICSKM